MTDVTPTTPIDLTPPAPVGNPQPNPLGLPVGTAASAPVTALVPAPAMPPQTYAKPGPDLMVSSADVLTRVLTPSMRTWEGKLAAGQVALIQVLLATFGLLTSTGQVHPSPELAAEIIGGGEAISGWITNNFLQSRATVKAAAAATAAPVTIPTP